VRLKRAFEAIEPRAGVLGHAVPQPRVQRFEIVSWNELFARGIEDEEPALRARGEREAGLLIIAATGFAGAGDDLVDLLGDLAELANFLGIEVALLRGAEDDNGASSNDR